MSQIKQIIADFETSLASKVSVSDTSASLQNATDDDGVSLPAGLYFFTIDGNNSQKEHIVCNLSGSSLTSISSVSRQGVESAGFAREHRIGASVVITDFAHILIHNKLLNGDSALDNLLKYATDLTPTDDKELVPKKYVDGVAIAGAPDASTTTKGISLMSVAPASAASPIAVGDNDPRVPTTDENDALIGTSGLGVSSSNVLVDNKDTDIGNATITGTTISFADSNPDTILDSGNGFITAGFRIGQSITISGSTSNDGTYTIDTVSAGTITLIATDSLTAESAGASVTITNNPAGKVARYNSSGLLQQDTTAPSSAGEVVALDSSAKLPAIDGSQLTGINDSYTGTASITASGDTVVTCGFRPRRVTIYAISGTVSATSMSMGVYDSGGNKCVYLTTATKATSSTYSWNVNEVNNANYNKGTVNTITDTGFTLTAEVSNSNAVLLYTAEK